MAYAHNNEPTNSDKKAREETLPMDLNKPGSEMEAAEKSKKELQNLSGEAGTSKKLDHLQDSSIHSLCKFNYIFYFIYKLKYDDSGVSGIEYAF